MTERFLNWCISRRGRKAASFMAAGLIGGVAFAHMAPHTILIEYYVDFLHHYRKGFAVPLSAETKEKFQKVLDILEVNPERRPFYQPFNIVGFHVGGIGSSFGKWGIRIGIPANFSYKTETDVDISRITLGGEKLASWETEAGKKLLKSLIISENAQNFAIAREIKMRETPKLMIDTFFATTCSFATYALSRSINTTYNLYAKPLVVRLIMYSLVTCFTLGNYFFVKDYSQVHYEQIIDKELKEKSPELAEGGKEYYTKLLLRNICLRSILGKEGERLYSPLGNENSFIRMKTLPLMQRREFFE
ncbi:transmembrane protein 177 [Coccinella septempunctata]|uniref:transmembrane protein 177 n=1 Tax=Coccinella septempunctata TaxID=41139 RepID=UPI001D069B0F|nr:transmembrane protein 177 [Coccinella septempunctata]